MHLILPPTKRSTQIVISNRMISQRPLPQRRQFHERLVWDIAPFCCIAHELAIRGTLPPYAFQPSLTQHMFAVAASFMLRCNGFRHSSHSKWFWKLDFNPLLRSQAALATTACIHIVRKHFLMMRCAVVIADDFRLPRCDNVNLDLVMRMP